MSRNKFFDNATPGSGNQASGVKTGAAVFDVADDFNAGTVTPGTTHPPSAPLNRPATAAPTCIMYRSRRARHAAERPL